MTDDCVRQLEASCRHIAGTLEALAGGQLYDAYEAKTINPDTLEDGYDEERYADLWRYVSSSDILGVRVTTDLEKKTVFGVCLTVAWGGPNIYIDTNAGEVQGYWGGARIAVPLSGAVCEGIDRCYQEIWDCS